ncbi:hypothetical protein E2562_013508 [Oryza meyeriana var. granulata]|uniref:DUF7963 domain-containing protein n=1 Tax=Oryza meyeriana var. granulata TaxID=110450 RepID=A0A6G1BUX3_9ORYZ|nr:hypothetical protein E2562_013508 [Oryza meyeriana var. granulata]
MKSLKMLCSPPAPAMGSEKAAGRAVQKRYEGLLTVLPKAVKGKGTWYWSRSSSPPPTPGCRPTHRACLRSTSSAAPAPTSPRHRRVPPWHPVRLSGVHSRGARVPPPPPHRRRPVAGLLPAAARAAVATANKASPGAMLPKPQADAALALLADWFLESSGGVSRRSFLRHVGLPELQRTDLARPRLDA